MNFKKESLSASGHQILFESSSGKHEMKNEIIPSKLESKFTAMKLEVENKESTDSSSTTAASVNTLLTYVLFFSHYYSILDFNKPLMTTFHQTFFSLFQNLVVNPLDISKQDIFKKVSSHFKIHMLFDYYSLYENSSAKTRMEDLKDFPADKLEKTDHAIIYKILTKLTYLFHCNMERFGEKGLNAARMEQIFPLKIDMTNEQKECNVLVIELMELPEIICVIDPEALVNTKGIIHDLETELDQKINSLDNLGVPIEMLSVFKTLFQKLNFKTDQEFLAPFVECYFMEMEFKTTHMSWKMDRLFLYQYVLIGQISFLASVLLEMHGIKPKKKGGFLQEIMNAKRPLTNQITPSTSKDTYRQVLKPTNYNYFLALSWLSEDDFAINLLIDELGKEGEILKYCLNSLEDDELTPLRLFYVFLMKLQARIDDCELPSKFVCMKALQFESVFINFLEKQKNQDFNKTVIEFINGILANILQIDNEDSFREDQMSNEKGVTNIYSITMKKIVLKYESSVYKESMMDVKEYSLIIEFNKNASFIVVKMKMPEFQMSIENGDELLYFGQIVCAKFPDLTLDIDETRRVVMKITIFYSQENSLFVRMLEVIDFLIIASQNFNIIGIRSIFYYKPTKDVDKYDMFVSLMKENQKMLKMTMEMFPTWRRIKKLFGCDN